MALVNRFSGILQGAMVLTGNTLQCRQSTSYPPGNDYTNGAYISINSALVAAAGFPGGTTFNSSQCSSTAQLNMTAGSTVQFANLCWVSTSPSNPNAAITFRTPLGDNTITPNSALNQTIGGNTWCTQDVKNIVNAAGSGTYTVLGNPGATIVNNSSVNGGAWYLIVIYKDTSMPYRYFSVNSGLSQVTNTSPSDFTFSNIVTPSSGTVNGYLLVTETFGDMGDAAQIFIGTSQPTSVKVGNSSTGTWNGVAPYAQINNMLPGNILIADCEDPNIGLLDTRGTFGTFNKDPFAVTAPPFARNVADVLGLDISNNLTNNQTTLFTRVTYSGTGGGQVSSQSIQVDVNAATVSLNKSVDKGIAGVGDTLTYTIGITNTGLANADNVVFIDTVPTGTTFISGTVTVDGVSQPSAVVAPPGINLGTIATNGAKTVTFSVKVSTTLPQPNPVNNQSQTTFNFIPGTGLSPVFTDATSNFATTTIVSAVLTSSKIATPQVGILDTITYTIPLNNIGNTTATNVVLVDTIPSTVSIVPGSLTQDGTSITGDPNPPGVTLNDIPANTTSTVSFKVTVLTIPSPNTVKNSATSNYTYEIDPTIPSTGSGAVSANIATTTINFATLTTTKSVNKQYADVGNTLIYTIVIKNSGNVTANNVVFIDTIPNDTTLVSGTFKQDSANITGSPNPPGATLPNSIAPNGTTTITFNVTINTIPNPNPIPNNSSETFSYTGNPDVPTTKTDSSNSNTVNTQVNRATLGSITKSVDKNFATCGDLVTYTIVLPNTGNVTAQNVIVKDTIPTGSSFVANSVSVNGTPQSGANPLTGITVPNIAPGSSATVTFSVQIQC